MGKSCSQANFLRRGAAMLHRLTHSVKSLSPSCLPYPFPMMVSRSSNRMASPGVSLRNSTPNCSRPIHRTYATSTSMGVWLAPGKISTWRRSPFWTGVLLWMAHPRTYHPHLAHRMVPASAITSHTHGGERAGWRASPDSFTSRDLEASRIG